MKEQNIVFSSSLNVNYDNQFIIPIQSFIKELMVIIGANNNEAMQMNVAIEEVLAFIIENFLDDRLTNVMGIVFKLLDDGKIIIEISNVGPPIFKEEIPHFKYDDDNSLNGLWYQLARNLVDDIQFISGKNEGWVVRLTKTISSVKFKLNANISTDSKVLLNLNARKAVPSDAAQLIHLAYKTYRYSYGISDYYDIEYLSSHIENGNYIIFVAENDINIIGAVSIKVNVLNRKSAELGAAMISPDYRKSTALLRLLKEIDNYHSLNPLNFDFFESVPVTTHTISQRALSKVAMGYKPFAVLLNITPGPNFINIDNRLGNRETLVLSYMLCGKFKFNKIFVPVIHQNIVLYIIENTGNKTDVLTEDYENFEGESEIMTDYNETFKEASVKMKSFGSNWFFDLRNAILNVQLNKPDVVNVRVATSNPLPKSFDEQLKNLGFLFNGIVVISLEEIHISYIQVRDPINFDVILLNDPIAMKLLDHIKEQCCSLNFN